MMSPGISQTALAPDISVIVPVLNEGALAAALAETLVRLAKAGGEVIVVDGGSTDDTRALLEASGLRVLPAAQGRAWQMNAGAAQARGNILVFLHADTVITPGALNDIHHAVAASPSGWGRFDVRIAGHSRWLPVVAFMMNWRSRLTGVVTGDQVFFMRRSRFDHVGGFPGQPIMEDIEMSQRLRRAFGFPACLRPPVVTSGRRWDTRGAWKTIVLMWQLRWAYWRGVPAGQLAERYR